MNALSAIKVPDDPGPFKRAEDRWKPYVDDPETASAFAGPVTHPLGLDTGQRADLSATAPG